MRNLLPHRRPSVTIQTEWQGHQITVTAGYYPSGEIGEVFADVQKGALRAVLADACTIASIALQHGVKPEELNKSMGRIPVMEWDAATQQMVESERPASPIGAVLEALLQEVSLAKSYG